MSCCIDNSQSGKIEKDKLRFSLQYWMKVQSDYMTSCPFDVGSDAPPLAWRHASVHANIRAN